MLLHSLSLYLLCLLFYFTHFSSVSCYQVDYSLYHNVSSYYSHVDALLTDPQNSPYLTRLPVQMSTDQGYSLEAISLSLNELPISSSSSKLLILLTFGEHACEFITVESYFDLLSYFLTSLSRPCSSPDSLLARFILSHSHLHLVGLTNPDGRRRLETSGNYCWRNNGRNVDLNRNTDWQFGGPGSSNQPQHEEYHGQSPFSERESIFLLNLVKTYNYTAYFSIHSGEQQIFVPFVDTESKRIRRRRFSTALELGLINYLASTIQYGTGQPTSASGPSAGPATKPYFHHSGIAYEMNSYSADGTIFDWMAGKIGVKYSICAEIWGGVETQQEDCFQQFNPNPSVLDRDTARIRVFYLLALVKLIETELGIAFPWRELGIRLDNGEEMHNAEKEMKQNHQGASARSWSDASLSPEMQQKMKQILEVCAVEEKVEALKRQLNEISKLV